MKNLNAKLFRYLSVGFSLIVFCLVGLIQGLDFRNFLDGLRLIPIVVAADGVAYFVFTIWFWRCKCLQGWLIPFPDLNGTWEGQIQMNLKDNEGKIPDDIPTILTIKQTFRRMSCVMRTEEMESHSYFAGFCIDKEAQVKRLCYSYTSKPKTALRDRSTPHDGTILFNIIGSPVEKLDGEYWTQRETSGTVTLTYRTSDLLDEIPSDVC